MPDPEGGGAGGKRPGDGEPRGRPEQPTHCPTCSAGPHMLVVERETKRIKCLQCGQTFTLEE